MGRSYNLRGIAIMLLQIKYLHLLKKKPPAENLREVV